MGSGRSKLSCCKPPKKGTHGRLTRKPNIAQQQTGAGTAGLSVAVLLARASAVNTETGPCAKCSHLKKRHQEPEQPHRPVPQELDPLNDDTATPVQLCVCEETEQHQKTITQILQQHEEEKTQWAQQVERERGLELREKLAEQRLVLQGEHDEALRVTTTMRWPCWVYRSMSSNPCLHWGIDDHIQDTATKDQAEEANNVAHPTPTPPRGACNVCCWPVRVRHGGSPSCPFLQETIDGLTSQLQAFQAKMKKVEESILSQNYKKHIQDYGSPSPFWEQELESLHFVIEMKNERIHELDRRLLHMETVKERSLALEERVTALQQENEDLHIRSRNQGVLAR
ncbi:coiled-coil domain-containing protein 69 [Echinops telfairi]|uniref:Coiled-coil domain-containing protein 69 n=1 Tax=Echinops telfairi TaxID=9371 RepID=A0AC55CKF1_ECHTE|nr:coiled-coil domain-containing protein 69 [Echinops telfairi]